MSNTKSAPKESTSPTQAFHELARSGMDAAADLNRRSLEVAGAQAALATQAAREALGLWESGMQQALRDGRAVVDLAAERARAAMERIAEKGA